MTRQTFLKGTLILIAAGMITRFLGFINRLVVARLMGEEGMGLYMMALPTLFLVMTITQLGLPVAISKRVAEAEAKGNSAKVKQILVVSLLLTTASSIVLTVVMILFAPWIGSHLYTDKRVVMPMIAISPIVPIIAVSSVLKGYFQGRQNMKPQSYALIIEQIVRISCVALFIKLLLPLGVEYAASGAMVSVVLGELISLLYMMYLFKRKKTFKMRARFFTYLKSSKTTLKELFSIALPSTGSRMIGSLSHFLEPILVAQALAIAGVATVTATKQYGELTGYVMPLLFLPTFITNSLSIALVPAISESEANDNRSFVHHRIRQAIRISFASGALATVLMSLFASPILFYMYGTGNAAQMLALMAPFFLLYYIQAPLQSALLAMDLAKPAMWNSLFGSMVKLSLLFILASNPNFGIMGVAISMCVGVMLVTLLHLAALKRTIAFSLSGIDMFKMGALLAITWFAGSVFVRFSAAAGNKPLTLIISFVLLGCCYVLLLFALKLVTKEEIRQLPFFQKRK